MGRLFGTDGVRGVANRSLSIELAAKIGQALAMVLNKKDEKDIKVFIGKDTRRSSDMLEAALAAGLTAGGADVILLGVLPTPAVSYLTEKHGVSAAVMITASHNPYEYNGIKIFRKGGLKLLDCDEKEIEDIILDHTEALVYADSDKIGTITDYKNAQQEYADYILSTIGGNSLKGKKILIDCSNGAASVTAPLIFNRCGCEAHIINSAPDGINVNENCGSTHIENMAEQVVKGGYDLGLAFDGDADRCLAVDEKGNIVDGDVMIAIFADALRRKGELKKDTAVVTVMTNYGFYSFAKENGIKVETTKVGDRYVLEKMLSEGYSIGGEQSGHIIFADYLKTGDGELSGLKLLETVCLTEKTLSQLSEIITIFPQVLINVKATDEMKANITESVELQNEIRRFGEILEGRGRILLRPSGTEPLIRVMAEGNDTAEIEKIVYSLKDTIEKYL